MKPDYIDDTNTRIRYSTCYGDTGFIKPLQICELMNSIAYVDEVINCEPYLGGCSNEPVESAVKRGHEILVHNDRAISAKDYESLAKEGCRSITKVKCLTNFNRQGKKEPGCITLAVSAVKGGLLNRPSARLRKQIYDYISQRSGENIVSCGRFYVVEPVYVEISLRVTLFAVDMDEAYKTEEEVLQKLNEFLDPNCGNFDKCGWEIGQMPHISMFYSLVKSVINVDYIEAVSIVYRSLKKDTFQEAMEYEVVNLPNVLVVNGNHVVNIKIK